MNVRRFVLCTLTIFGLAFLSPAASGAADALKAARAQLTGDGTRTWILKAMQVFMGPGNGCKQGEVYKFSASGTLEIDKCEGGKVVATTGRWSLEVTSPIDVVLHFRGLSANLLFSEDGKRMRLQYAGSSLKLVPTPEADLRLSED